jgi:hypothetical protein
MADLKLVLKPKSGKHAFDAAEIKPNWANKTAFAKFSARQQTSEIWDAVRGLVKDSALRQKAMRGNVTITGLPGDAEDYPGSYKMDVFVDKTRACRMSVDIEEGKGKKIVDVGFKSLSNSESAVKLLKSVKKEYPFFKDKLLLKKGDGEHPDSILWQLGSERNSLPMNTHTKGEGKKNEKVALDKLKKTMKKHGYV